MMTVLDRIKTLLGRAEKPARPGLGIQQSEALPPASGVETAVPAELAALKTALDFEAPANAETEAAAVQASARALTAAASSVEGAAGLIETPGAAFDAPGAAPRASETSQADSSATVTVIEPAEAVAGLIEIAGGAHETLTVGPEPGGLSTLAPDAPSLGAGADGEAAAPVPLVPPAGFTAFEQDLELRYTWVQQPCAWLTIPGALHKLDADLLESAASGRVTAVKRRALDTLTQVRERVEVDWAGAPRWVELMIAPRHNAAGTLCGLSGMMLEPPADAGKAGSTGRSQDAELLRLRQQLASEVAARQAAEERLLEPRDHDPATGLPGRPLFDDRLALAVAHAARDKIKLGVLALRLDSLPSGADGVVAEELLRAVVGAFQDCLRHGDTLARLGNAEFGVLLPGIKRSEDVSQVAEKLRLALRRPFSVSGEPLLPSACIGVALFPDDGDTPRELQEGALRALQRAREHGGDSIEIFGPKTAALADARRALEDALRQALLNHELALFYQPIIDCRNGSIIALEALLRWHDPEHRLVAAGEFVPLADTTSLAVPLGQWALRTACAQARAWHRAGFAGLCVAVNLSARQLMQPQLPRLVARVLEETGLPPACLDLEVAEADLMENAERVVSRMRELKRLGVTLSIDNFGAGRSVLTQLHRYPVDALKIDGSVIRNIARDRNQEAVASAAIALGRTRKLRVVAEGVETDDQQMLVGLWQCDCMQGTLCGAPKNVAETETLLAWQWLGRATRGS